MFDTATVHAGSRNRVRSCAWPRHSRLVSSRRGCTQWNLPGLARGKLNGGARVREVQERAIDAFRIDRDVDCVTIVPCGQPQRRIFGVLAQPPYDLRPELSVTIPGAERRRPRRPEIGREYGDPAESG